MPEKTEEILGAAWRMLAANPALNNGFPRGFWPDLARVAVEMALQGTLEPELDFRPTHSGDVCVKLGKVDKDTPQGGRRVHIPKPVKDFPDNPFLRN